MPCGCENTCGCIILDDGETTSVSQQGDTFIISAIPFIRTVEDTDCIDLEVDIDGNLTAVPIINADPATVTLSCGPDGLEAALLIDPSSTAIVTQSAAGLQVDVPPPPPTPDQVPAGSYLFYSGLANPVNYLAADGSQQVRAIYPDLWDALTLVGSTATRNSASAVITGIDSTEYARAGMTVEATNFPAATIVSVDSPTQITLDQVSSGTGSDTVVRIYPYGDGDGLNTFNVPNMDRRFPLGYDPLNADTMGTQGGLEDVSLTVPQLATHDHNVAVSADQAAHDHSGLTGTEPAHNHGVNGGRSFVTVDNPQTTVQVADNTPNDITLAVTTADLEQKNNIATASNGSHDHTIPAADPAISTIVSEDAIGSGDPHENMPPCLVGRWLIHT